MMKISFMLTDFSEAAGGVDAFTDVNKFINSELDIIIMTGLL